jgi:hypothetical protein
MDHSVSDNNFETKEKLWAQFFGAAERTRHSQHRITSLQIKFTAYMTKLCEEQRASLEAGRSGAELRTSLAELEAKIAAKDVEREKHSATATHLLEVMLQVKADVDEQFQLLEQGKLETTTFLQELRANIVTPAPSTHSSFYLQDLLDKLKWQEDVCTIERQTVAQQAMNEVDGACETHTQVPGTRHEEEGGYEHEEGSYREGSFRQSREKDRFERNSISPVNNHPESLAWKRKRGRRQQGNGSSYRPSYSRTPLYYARTSKVTCDRYNRRHGCKQSWPFCKYVHCCSTCRSHGHGAWNCPETH